MKVKLVVLRLTVTVY